MAKIVWDNIGEKFYETGVDHGVLYVQAPDGKYPKGVAWNGLINVSESPSGAEPTKLYADNINYLNMTSAEEFGATIEAFTYPPEFEQCDGSATLAKGIKIGQQNRKPFGFVYRTLRGNDTQGTDFGYKLHLVYGCQASPSERGYGTVNDSPDAITFSWDITTTPVPVKNNKPTAILTIDSADAAPEALSELETILFGGSAPDATPRLPLPDEIAELAIPFETEEP